MATNTIICECCYNEMPVGTTVCERCGTILIDKGKGIALLDRRTMKEIRIEKNVVIGRGNSGTLFDKAFTENPHISAPHCEVFQDGGEWFIKDLGSLNKTAVDGIVIDPDTPIRLMEGKKLRIADLYFIVRMGTDKKETAASADKTSKTKPSITTTGQYYVKCPECGWEMVLDSPNSKLERCTNCGDVDSVPFIRPLRRIIH